MQSNTAKADSPLCYEAEEMARYVRCGCGNHIGMLKKCLANRNPEDSRILWAILQTQYPKEANAISQMRSKATARASSGQL